MSQFHALTIQSLEREPANTTVIQFEIPEGLASDFHFLPGQYLTLSVEVNGQEERRSYSLCSNPYAEQGHRVAVKVVAGGKVSTYLNQQVQVGDTIDVKVPEGISAMPSTFNQQEADGNLKNNFSPFIWH